MDSFETVVATILERDGFWVRTSLKVELTKEEKREIGRPSSPRWEIDVVGYRAGDNLLRVVECKSYLDSGGVNISAFDHSCNMIAWPSKVAFIAPREEPSTFDVVSHLRLPRRLR